MTFNPDFPPLSPVSFFEVTANCFYLQSDSLSRLSSSRYLLPDTSPLTGEEHFADVYTGWNEEGIHFLIKINAPFQEVFYPDFSRGDAVELFINTNPVKQLSGFNTPFCHHFFFLPKEYEGIKCAEITKFRRDEPRELAAPKDLHSETEFSRNHYKMKIFLPSSSLHGYDPSTKKTLGFSYRIHCYGRPPQHFNVLTETFSLENQASQWSNLDLVSI